MTYAETPRLHLRALEKSDLPRVVELIGDWEVARWLSLVPHPYYAEHAEEFFKIQSINYSLGRPEFFAVADRESNSLLGGIGFRSALPLSGELVLGYWLGKPYWGRGFMTEAVAPALRVVFQNQETRRVVAVTDIDNTASQNVLRKIGFQYLGLIARPEPALRGSAQVTSWQLDRRHFLIGPPT